MSPVTPMTVTLTWTKERNPFVFSFEFVATDWISNHILALAKEFEPQGALVDTTATVLTTEGEHTYVYLWKVVDGEAHYVTRTGVIPHTFPPISSS